MNNNTLKEHYLNNDNFSKFINTLTELSISHNFIISCNFAEAEQDKKICYTLVDRNLVELQRYKSFLRNLEFLTRDTGIMLNSIINMIDIDDLAVFDCYKTEKNQLIGNVKNFDLKHIRQLRILKFVYDK